MPNTGKAAATSANVSPGRAGALGGVVGSGYAISRQTATIHSEVTGRVAEMLVQEGDTVRKDQIIARLDDTVASRDYAVSLSKAKEEEAKIDVAKIDVESALEPLARLTRLNDHGATALQGVTAARFLAQRQRAQLALAEASAATAQHDAERAEAIVAQHVVRAPFDGIIAKRLVNVGDTSLMAADGGGRDQGIAVMFDPAALEVAIEVAESSISRVEPGQAADAVFDAAPERHYTMLVRTIVPVGSRERGTVAVRLGFTAPPDNIFPDMAAKVTLEVDGLQQAKIKADREQGSAK
jgi:RND family efflux transporter MFP subunit